MHRQRAVSNTIRTDAIFERIFWSTLKTFSSAQTGKAYMVRQKLSCNSTNVIYLVHCKKCNLQYVRSTTTELKIRFRNHKSTMKTNMKTCEVALHFNRTPHILSDFNFQCIDQIQTNTSQDTEKLLFTKEAYWSAQLFSFSPFGLNKRQEFHSKNRTHYTYFGGVLAPGWNFLRYFWLLVHGTCYFCAGVDTQGPGLEIRYLLFRDPIRGLCCIIKSS